MNVGYIRVSTAEQERSGLSLAAQTAAVKKYAILRDLPLERIFSDVTSGRTMDRPAFNELRALVDGRRVTAVVVYRLDRLARTTRGAIEFAEEMERAGVAFHSVTEALDTSTPQGRLFYAMIAAFAQMERELCSLRIREAMAVKRERGEWVGRPPPGHKVVGRRLVPDPRHPYPKKLDKALRAVRAGSTFKQAAVYAGVGEHAVRCAMRRLEAEVGAVERRRRGRVQSVLDRG